MKRNLLTFFVLVSMLLGMVSSASATNNLSTQLVQQTDQPATDSVVAKVYFTSQEELNNLAARYDILQVNQEPKFVYILLSTTEVTSLQQAGYRVEIDAAKTKLLTQPHPALPGQGPDTIPGYPCYRTVEETYTSMQNIATAHPDMAAIYDIGYSWTRVHSGYPYGYDILALRLSNTKFGKMSDKPTFFLMAEIHAREYVTAETAMRYAEYLINNYGIDPDITWLLDYFRVFIVTMTNPDGRKIAEQGILWRKNVDNLNGCTDPNSWGTDLNRNHTFKWNHGGSSPYPCDETYMGPSAGSEPEVQAIESFVLTLFPDQRGPGDTDPAPSDTTGVFITLHSYAQVVLYPWGWTSAPAPNSTQLATLGRKFGFFNQYQVCQSNSNCMYPTSGTSDDWSYGTLGIASYTFEMGTDFFESCASFESTTYPQNLPALIYAFKAARRPYQNPLGPDSINVTASPAAAAPGDPVLVTAIADDTRYNGGEPTQNIAEARYSIDSPSWITDTVTYTMAASDGSFDSKVEAIQATIDTSGLSAGRHTIFVESKDINNNWGVPSATFLYIAVPGVSPVIQGYVRQADTNLPLAANITAGLFTTTTDPATGYYSMTVISGTYDMVVNAANFAPAYAKGVVAHNYQTIQQDFLLYPYCTIFSDNVESGNQGWTPDTPWGITTKYAHSPTHSWTDSPNGNYGNNVSVSLTSKVFDLSGFSGVSLSFWHKYITEQNFDFGNVEYSTDGTNWYNIASYSGVQNNFSQIQLSIPQLDGQSTAQVRFHFTSDSNTTYDGWYVDDIAISGGGPSCIPHNPPQANFTSNSPVHLGESIDFTNQTTGTLPITYTWDFGDGIGTSTETNPAYIYADVGTYTVTLVATNKTSTDSISHAVTVNPVAYTSVNLTQLTNNPIFIGNMVSFSADMLPDNAGKPYNYTINYGDGTIITDISSLDPLFLDHIFKTSGKHTVQVWVWNAGMSEPVTSSLIVDVNYYMLYMPLTYK
jgi:carboxypeptidase T